MLTIRFNRVGKKNKAYFRVVLQEHTIAPGGKHIEILGSWDPHLKKAVLKGEKIKYWVSKGAQVSDSAYNLFIKEGIVEGKKRVVKLPKKAEPEAETPEVKPAEDKKEEKREENKTEEMIADEPKPEDAKSEEKNPEAEKEVDKK